MTAPTAPAIGPVVHRSRDHKLTLSEVDAWGPAPAPPSYPQVAPGDSTDITSVIGNRTAVAGAIARHLSPRAAGPVGDPTRYRDPEASRAAFLLDALAKAAECPVCAPDLRAAGLVR